jgi:hypothetical protein
MAILLSRLPKIKHGIAYLTRNYTPNKKIMVAWPTNAKKRDEDVRKPKSENFSVFGASLWQFKATSCKASDLKVISLKRELNFASEKLLRKKI